MSTSLDASMDGSGSDVTVRLVCSGLTDTRWLEQRLRDQGVGYEVERLGMATADMRDRFQALKQQVGWASLPMVFIGDRFIGGELELAEWLIHRDDHATADRVPVAAAYLVALGFVPFAGGLVGVWLLDDPWRSMVLTSWVAYAAIILSFMGGIYWGATLREKSPKALWWLIAVSPSLVAWLAFALPESLALLTLAAAFGAVYLLDVYAIRRGRLPAWYRSLRVPVSISVTASLLLGSLIEFTL